MYVSAVQAAVWLI